MDAIVEVATAMVASKAVRVMVIAHVTFLVTVLSHAVATFAMRIPTLGSHSLSAVAPDADLREELAEAGA
jgi:hypothetical protein